jgi:hypothetical protein
MTTTQKQYSAGRYYVGDLCYVNALGKFEGRWERICESMFPSGSQHAVDGDHCVDGIDFWVHGTAHGDGSFNSNINFDFPVDAGIIGICTEEVALADGYYGGTIVEFSQPFTPEYEYGTFSIGHVTITTDDDCDDDCDDDYSEDH